MRVIKVATNMIHGRKRPAAAGSAGAFSGFGLPLNKFLESMRSNASNSYNSRYEHS